MAGGSRSPGTGGSRYALGAGAAGTASTPLSLPPFSLSFRFSGEKSNGLLAGRPVWAGLRGALPQRTWGHGALPPPLRSLCFLGNNCVHALGAFIPSSLNQRAATRWKISWVTYRTNHRRSCSLLVSSSCPRGHWLLSPLPSLAPGEESFTTSFHAHCTINAERF